MPEGGGRGGPFQDHTCDHVTGRLLGLSPTPLPCPQRLLWILRPNVPRPSGSEQNHPSLEPSVSWACRPWGGGYSPGFCLTWGQAPSQGSWGPTPPREQSARTCQEQERLISKGLGRGKRAAKLNLRERGF